MNCFDGTMPSTECLRMVLETMAEGVVMLDHHGTVRYCNHAMETLTGRSKSNIVGSTCRELMECACVSAEECEFMQSARPLESAE